MCEIYSGKVFNDCPLMAAHLCNGSVCKKKHQTSESYDLWDCCHGFSVLFGKEKEFKARLVFD
jgi:hypothetical protein